MKKEIVENKENKEEKNLVEDIKPIDMSGVNLHEVNKDINLDNFEQDVEDARLNIQKEYKNARKLSNLMTFIMVAFVIVAIILLTQNIQACKIAGYVVGGVALVGMLVFWGVNRNKMPNKITKYMNDTNEKFNAFLYKDNKFQDLSCDSKEKLDMGEIASDRVYTNIKGLGSRNALHGSYEDHRFLVADVKAVTISSKNKEEDLFVGKYLSIDNNLKFDGRIIVNICLKGEKTYDIPNDVEDLEEVSHDGQMTIWATPGLDYKKVITNDIINKLNKLEVKEEKHLYNVNIVFWGGHTGAYLSYDNSVMSFPFEEPFKKEGLERFKRDQELMFEVFAVGFKEKIVKTIGAKKASKQEKTSEEVTASQETADNEKVAVEEKASEETIEKENK